MRNTTRLSDACRLFAAGALLTLVGGIPASAQSGRIYSYTNENGLRVITNIPPADQPPGIVQYASLATPASAPPAAAPKAAPARALSGPERALASARRSEQRSDRISAQADLEARTADISPVETVVAAPVAAPSTASSAGLDGSAIDPLIVKYATHYKIEPDLVRALIKAESNFNPRAISNKGARGLMQLMPGTAWRYGVRNIMDPEENIAGGVHYLSDLLQMFDGRIDLALSAYNAGENLVQKIKRVPAYAETRTYVARIGNMFDFRRSAFITPEIPPEPRVRMVRRADGVLEITNVNSPPAIAAQMN